MARLGLALLLSLCGSAHPACVFQAGTDCYGDALPSPPKNSSTVLTEVACCRLCAADPKCAVAVYIPSFPNPHPPSGVAACMFKSNCSKPTPFPNRVKCCQPGDPSCPPPPPPPPAYPCPCTTCPCPKGEVLPRTCDPGSVAASLPFCDHNAPIATRVADLVSRLTREEKINLVTQADTGFLPRLNLKEFNFFNTCVHGWWTHNATTFGMPVTFAATFDTAVMRQIADVIGTESRAMSQRDYKASFDAATGLHGVALDWLVCKDSAEVNMNRHPLWGRNPETYGEDPFLTATMGEAFTQQLQQPDPTSKYIRTTAVTRHLVVYSGPEGGPNCKGCPPRVNRFSFNANVAERDLGAHPACADLSHAGLFYADGSC